MVLHENVTVTPHLGASTTEAQVREKSADSEHASVCILFMLAKPIIFLNFVGFCLVTSQEGVAIEIAEAVVGALKGELASTAVNAPMVPAEVSYSLYV